jgi:predicted amidohydrolase YtcJ
LHRIALLPLALLLLLIGVDLHAQGGTDVVLVGGKVWTGVASQPQTEAVAIRGSRILAIGTSAAMLKLAMPTARIVQLNGRLVLPGFNDAHVHVQLGGANLVGVHLTDAKSKAEFRQRIAAFAKIVSKGSWILNGLWDQERWSPIILPTHQLIDDVTPDNPVAVARTDLHMILANAYAMKLAGVDRNTKDVPGGVILRDAEGNPTGIFKDAATALILSHVPVETEKDMETYFLATQKLAVENGVTSVQDMAVSANDPSGRLKLQALQALARQGRLKLRVAECLPLIEGRQMAELGIEANFGDEMFHIGCLKSFADGGLGASTAWFTAPYTDNPFNYGIASDTMQHPEEAYAEFEFADQTGLQLITHAIGDRANHVVLDFYERIEKEDGPRDRRDRIEMRRRCCRRIFRALQSCISSPPCSRSMPSTTDAGQKSASVPNASKPPMPSVHSWTQAPWLRLDRIGQSPHWFR